MNRARYSTASYLICCIYGQLAPFPVANASHTDTKLPTTKVANSQSRPVPQYIKFGGRLNCGSSESTFPDRTASALCGFQFRAPIEKSKQGHDDTLTSEKWARRRSESMLSTTALVRADRYARLFFILLNLKTHVQRLTLV